MAVATPTTTFSAATVAQTRNAPSYCLYCRGDYPQISLLETLLPGETKCFYVRTRPADGSEKHRDHYKRFNKVKVFGEGNITSGVIIATADSGWQEPYDITLAKSLEAGVLCEQWFTPGMCGYAIDVQILATGAGVVIRDIVSEYIVLN